MILDTGIPGIYVSVYSRSVPGSREKEPEALTPTQPPTAWEIL